MHLIGIQIGWTAIHRWHIFFYICRHYLPVRRYYCLFPCRFQYFNSLFWRLRTNSQVIGIVYFYVMLLLWLWTKIEETFTFDGIDRSVRSSRLFILVQSWIDLVMMTHSSLFFKFSSFLYAHCAGSMRFSSKTKPIFVRSVSPILLYWNCLHFAECHTLHFLWPISHRSCSSLLHVWSEFGIILLAIKNWICCYEFPISWRRQDLFEQTFRYNFFLVFNCTC